MNLSTSNKITKVLATTATGTSTINSAIIDMANFENITFLVSLGTAAADNGIKVQQGAAANMSDAADLLGSQVLSDATQVDLVVEVVRPQGRYVRVSVVRGTTTTIEAAWGVQSGAHNQAVENTTAAQAAEIHFSPIEGTA